LSMPASLASIQRSRTEAGEAIALAPASWSIERRARSARSARRLRPRDAVRLDWRRGAGARGSWALEQPGARDRRLLRPFGAGARLRILSRDRARLVLLLFRSPRAATARRGFRLGLGGGRQRAARGTGRRPQGARPPASIGPEAARRAGRRDCRRRRRGSAAAGGERDLRPVPQRLRCPPGRRYRARLRRAVDVV